MTLHLHDYGHIGVGAGGAPINYAEVSRLLLGEPGLSPRRHDFYALVQSGDSAPLDALVGNGDTLVCTVGPYAHLYHYWRERSGRDVRIIRDARTAAWAPYLAQEWLTAPLVRPGDVVVFPSGFAQSFYRRLFPHITEADSQILYPLAGHPRRGRPPVNHGPLRIGCLGRIADDKNITAALKVLARIRTGRPAELHLAGPFYPRSREVGSPAALLRTAAAMGLPADAVAYRGNLPHEAIWEFLDSVDVLFFPAVSSNETFGRVIVEAGRAGVPVIATDFAAAPELLPPANVIPVCYRPVRRARLSSPFALGEPDPERAAAALLAAPAAHDVLDDARYSRSAFLRMVSGADVPAPFRFEPSPGVQRFIESVTIDGISPVSAAQARELCAAQLRFMRRLNHPGWAVRLRAFARLAPYLPGDRMLRRVARERLLRGHAPGVLRNAVASGRVLGFDPRLTLSVPGPGGGDGGAA